MSDSNEKYYRYGMRGFVDFTESPPRSWRWPCFCFALDYETKEPIMLETMCKMIDCQECIPQWWMAL